MRIENGKPIGVCFNCKKPPEMIYEYIDGSIDANRDYAPGKVEMTPALFVQTQEGTYNPKNGNFCCTDCYIAIGCPRECHTPGCGFFINRAPDLALSAKDNWPVVDFQDLGNPTKGCVEGG